MVVIDLPYKPRDYQQAFERAMFSGKKRALLVWHRRAGKDLACFNFLINEALKKVGVYHYVLPTHTQARKVIWDGITNDGKKYIDFIPSQIIHNKNNTEMKIWLKNGSLIQLLGSNNADSIAGTNPIGVVLSEYSLQDPTAMDLIYGPILAANHGWLVVNGTARGKNHQYTLHRMAERNPNWFVSVLTIEDTNIISQERVEEERAEGKSEEIIQQEYYCSYQRGVEGAFYGRLMEKVYKDDRVTHVPLDPSVPVDTFWDLGYGDSTVVVFAQRVGQEIHIIDHYENRGEGLEHYVRYVKAKDYLYGEHYGPHDVDAGHLGIGMSIKSLALSLGLKFRTVPRARIEAGIEAVRSILPRCWFDKKNCTFLVQALENYAANYNATMGCYSNTPRHDRFSHSCDAMRYLASTYLSNASGTKLTPDAIKKMREKFQGAVGGI